jgi:hypothetical protein
VLHRAEQAGANLVQSLLTVGITLADHGVTQPALSVGRRLYALGRAQAFPDILWHTHDLAAYQENYAEGLRAARAATPTEDKVQALLHMCHIALASHQRGFALDALKEAIASARVIDVPAARERARQLIAEALDAVNETPTGRTLPELPLSTRTIQELPLLERGLLPDFDFDYDFAGPPHTNLFESPDLSFFEAVADAPEVQSMDDARRMCKGFGHEEMIAECYVYFVAKLHKPSERGIPQSVLREVLRQVRLVPSPGLRARLLLALVEASEPSPELRLLGAAARDVDRLSFEREGCDLRCRVSIQYTKIGDLRNARLAVKGCSAEDRLRSYTAVLVQVALGRQPGLQRFLGAEEY